MKFIFENMGELNERVVFEDGTICEVSIDNDGYGDAYFMYRGVKFTLESDVEKDLSYTFNQKYVNMTVDNMKLELESDGYAVSVIESDYPIRVLNINSEEILHYKSLEDAYFELIEEVL